MKYMEIYILEEDAFYAQALAASLNRQRGLAARYVPLPLPKDWIVSHEGEEGKKRIFLLSEQEAGLQGRLSELGRVWILSGKRLPGREALYRYQPLSGLLAAIAEKEEEGEPFFGEGQKRKKPLLLGAQAGPEAGWDEEGQEALEAVCLKISAALAKKNQRVLLVGPKERRDKGGNTEGEGPEALFLYRLLYGQEEGRFPYESYLKKTQEGVFVYGSGRDQGALWELSAQEISLFLARLKRDGFYDAVIFCFPLKACEGKAKIRRACQLVLQIRRGDGPKREEKGAWEEHEGFGVPVFCRGEEADFMYANKGFLISPRKEEEERAGRSAALGLQEEMAADYLMLMGKEAAVWGNTVI